MENEVNEKSNGYRKRDDEKKTAAKTRNRAKLLDFLGDPENEWPKRSTYSTLLGYSSPNQVYRTISPQDLDEIEIEAMEIRKARTVRHRADILNTLYNLAMGFEKEGIVKLFKGNDDHIISHKYTKYFPPNPQAAKEFLDRTEGKVTDRHELFGKHGGSIKTDNALSMDINTVRPAIDIEGAKKAFAACCQKELKKNEEKE